MTTFSTAVQGASLLSLIGLLIYTLWLMRSGRLSAHITVNWILAETAAILAVILWSWLPLFSVTSGLDDRELLVILAVVLFVLIGFLMLDSLARISAHTFQIKRLTQEVALLRVATDEMQPKSAMDAHAVERQETTQEKSITKASESQRSALWPKLLAALWIFACVAFFIVEMQDGYFLTLKSGLTASYLQ